MPRFYGLRLTLGRRDYATVLGSSGPRNTNSSSRSDLNISKKQKKSPAVTAVMTLHITPLGTACTSSTTSTSTACNPGSGMHRASFAASSSEASCDGAGEAQVKPQYSTTNMTSRSSFSADGGIGNSTCSGALGSSPASSRKFTTPISSQKSGSRRDENNVAAFEEQQQEEEGDAGAQVGRFSWCARLLSSRGALFPPSVFPQLSV